MKKRYYTLLSFMAIAQFVIAQQQWTWMNGNKATGTAGNYGIQGIPSPSTFPGSRMGACTWTDNQGNFWLFGGRGLSASSNGLLNDLWRYNPSNKQWTWIGGANTTNNQGQYGILGLPIFQQPGSRENAASWTDAQGNFWMFGGSGYANNDSETGLLNDLWRYSPSLNSWTWVGGSNDLDEEGRYGRKGEASSSNFPGGRFLSSTWTDDNGNLWLFGGFGYADNDNGQLNDLWKYSPGSEEWTWMKGDKSDDGDARYGRKGEFANNNTPGARQGSTAWKDQDGNFWLYGGENSNDLFCDLWNYNPDNDQWAWMSGTEDENEQPEYDDIGVPTTSGHPGSRTLASGWVDPLGDLWLFGGRGYGGNSGSDPLNNIWKYSISNNNWTFVKGDASNNPTPVYGDKEVPHSDNKPGGTQNASSWTDANGIFWFFGGRSSDGLLNQVWSFSPCQGGNISPASAAICEGSSQELTATGGSTYEWRRNNVVIGGQTNSKYTATEPGTYSVVIKNGACAVSGFNSVEVTRATAPTGTISPSSATICKGSFKTLTATGGTSYQWKLNGLAIPGITGATINADKPGTYSVIITNGTCSGPASNTAVITEDPVPAGTITPATASLCENATQTLTATGGTSYEWMRDGEILNGQTSATITVSTPGIYSVVVKGGACSGPAANTAEVIAAEDNGIRYADVFATANKPVRLTARNAGTHFQWTPSKGLDDPSSASPMATLDADQLYTIHISSSQSCSLVDTQLVKVSAANNTVKIHVPTAFTPNGNNVNDRLRPLGNIGKIDYFRVYNRWGNLVYQTSIIGEGWDGRNKGVLQQTDTYTWIFSGQMTDGQPIKLSGKTVLIR